MTIHKIEMSVVNVLWTWRKKEDPCHIRPRAVWLLVTS